jgi:hypothetical protein
MVWRLGKSKGKAGGHPLKIVDQQRQTEHNRTTLKNFRVRLFDSW